MAPIFRGLRVRRVGKSSSPLSFSSELTGATRSENLNILKHKDWLAPNESVSIIRNLKDPSSVISIFDQLSKRRDYRPNETLYASVINKLAHAKKLDEIEDLMERIKRERNCRLSEDFFYNVIRIYGNAAGGINRAILTFFEMPKYGYWPTVKSFNFVLNLLVTTKQFDVIHEVYMGGAQLGIEADACTFNILIKGLCEWGNLEAAFNMLDEFPQQKCTPNVQTYSTLIHALCKHGRVKEAREVLEEMEKMSVEPDTITFNILIWGLRKEGKTEEAMNLLNEMQYKGCSPNDSSYQEVLYALLVAERFVEAKNFMSEMISRGIGPCFSFYTPLILGLFGKSLFDDANWVLERMVDQGYAPKVRMWKAVLDKVVQGWNSDLNLQHIMETCIYE